LNPDVLFADASSLLSRGWQLKSVLCKSGDLCLLILTGNVTL
jgi:hypothetical protein